MRIVVGKQSIEGLPRILVLVSAGGNLLKGFLKGSGG
jgi:hypothetical protein